jgi:hypothetical protein
VALNKLAKMASEFDNGIDCPGGRCASRIWPLNAQDQWHWSQVGEN